MSLKCHVHTFLTYLQEPQLLLFPGQPVPMAHHISGEEIPPSIYSEPPLGSLKLFPHVLCSCINSGFTPISFCCLYQLTNVVFFLLFNWLCSTPRQTQLFLTQFLLYPELKSCLKGRKACCPSRKPLNPS